MSYTVTATIMMVIGGALRRDHSRPADDAERHRGLFCAVQRALYDARLGDDLSLRRPLRLRRAREHHRAHSNRRPGHGLSATERLKLLALSHRLDHDALGLFVAGGAANFGWVAYAPLSNSTKYFPAPARTYGSARCLLTGFSAIFTGVNVCADGLLSSSARHDDVSHANLHLGTCW